MEDGVHMATYTDDNRTDVPKGFKKILKRYNIKVTVDINLNSLEKRCLKNVMSMCMIYIIVMQRI